MSRLTLEQTELSLKRWRTKLKRAMTAIETLERKRKRLLKKPLAEIIKPVEITADSVTVTLHDNGVLTTHATPVSAVDLERQSMGRLIDKANDPAPTPLPQIQGNDHLDIPGFLRRADPAPPKGYVVDAGIEQVKAEIEAHKKAKTKARIAKMKAAKSGDLRKMPLSGKAAREAIRNG